MSRISTALAARLRAFASDQGDVPGWVLVTVMTAGLVTAIWVVADDLLQQMFSDAVGSVRGS